jgi:hypothetical protein
MEMHAVMVSFRNLCDDPVAWGVIGLIAIKAFASVMTYTRCPLLRNPLSLSPEDAEAMVHRRVLHSPRFLALMILGILLAIGGLYTVSDPAYGALGLAAIVIGAFILIVEPSQLSIEENQLRVAAVGCKPGEAMDLAMDRLRWSHLERIAIEVALAAALVLILAIY